MNAKRLFILILLAYLLVTTSGCNVDRESLTGAVVYENINGRDIVMEDFEITAGMSLRINDCNLMLSDGTIRSEAWITIVNSTVRISGQLSLEDESCFTMENCAIVFEEVVSESCRNDGCCNDLACCLLGMGKGALAIRNSRICVRTGISAIGGSFASIRFAHNKITASMETHCIIDGVVDELEISCCTLYGCKLYDGIVRAKTRHFSFADNVITDISALRCVTEVDMDRSALWHYYALLNFSADRGYIRNNKIHKVKQTLANMSMLVHASCSEVFIEENSIEESTLFAGFILYCKNAIVRGNEVRDCRICRSAISVNAKNSAEVRNNIIESNMSGSFAGPMGMVAIHVLSESSNISDNSIRNNEIEVAIAILGNASVSRNSIIGNLSGITKCGYVMERYYYSSSIFYLGNSDASFAYIIKDNYICRNSCSVYLKVVPDLDANDNFLSENVFQYVYATNTDNTTEIWDIIVSVVRQGNTVLLGDSLRIYD